MKITELRTLYEKVSRANTEAGQYSHKDPLIDQAYDDSDASFISEEISAYFAQENGAHTPETTETREKPKGQQAV